MKRLQALEAITRVLFEDWDPIGVRGYGNPAEYRGYAKHVYTMLESGSNSRDLALHLSKVSDSLGLGNVPEELHAVAAERLLALRLSGYRQGRQ